MTSKLVLGMALGASAAVGTASVLGNGLTPPEVLGALGMAGVIGVINVRAQRRPRPVPHALTAPADVSVPATIAAPRAGEVVAPHSQHTDAA